MARPSPLPGGVGDAGPATVRNGLPSQWAGHTGLCSPRTSSWKCGSSSAVGKGLDRQEGEIREELFPRAQAPVSTRRLVRTDCGSEETQEDRKSCLKKRRQPPREQEPPAAVLEQSVAPAVAVEGVGLVPRGMPP